MWIEHKQAEFHILAMLRDKIIQVACVSYEMFNCTVHLEQVLSKLYQTSKDVLHIMDVLCVTALPLCLLPFLFFCSYAHILLFHMHIPVISHLF